MNPYPIFIVSTAKSQKTPGLVVIQYFAKGERKLIGSMEFKEQRLQLFVTSATMMSAGQKMNTSTSIMDMHLSTAICGFIGQQNRHI